jgi:hypothetical protein
MDIPEKSNIQIERKPPVCFLAVRDYILREYPGKGGCS